jgi:hypothetical protein
MAAKAVFPSWQVPQFWPAPMLAMVNFAVPFGMEKALGWQSAQLGLRAACRAWLKTTGAGEPAAPE